MTIIKYATIGFSRLTETLSVFRGKKTGKIGHRPPKDEDHGHFDDPIYCERVVELPESMTPTEYDEYINENYGVPADDPITKAVLDVAEEKGVDLDVDDQDDGDDDTDEQDEPTLDDFPVDQGADA